MVENAGEVLSDLAGVLGPVADRLRAATVHVRGAHGGGGSGIIWTSDGLVVTNAHVLRGGTPAIELADGRTCPGEIKGVDREHDLAVIALSATDLVAAETGDSESLRVGQLVIAVGNPLGLSGAVTTGIIHAIGDERDRVPWVQADVHLAPGNSGGPLADVHGRVIGVNSMIAGGLALAVPSNVVTRFLRAYVSRPRLGIKVQEVSFALTPGYTTGLLVLELEAGSPAAEAGLIIGDIVLKDHVEPSVSDTRPWSPELTSLEILRAGERRTITVSTTSGPGIDEAA